MAQIVLSEAGAALGAQLLPDGIGLLGQTLGGELIGRTLGSLAGGAIDTAVFGPGLEGPRLTHLHLMESRDGAGLPRIMGRMRRGGQLIWAARFREETRERGGKGGPTVTEYGYTASFAVALCEGPVQRVGRIWANGEVMDLTGVNVRVYSGTEDQVADPLIEAVEGPGRAPAYRGTAYLVFEDLPLGPFGNRLPQISAEIHAQPPDAEGTALARHVRGVNLIPASGEFVYATDTVRIRRFPGIERPVNANTPAGVSDFEASLDQLQADLPGVDRVALTVGWFGDDLRADRCRIQPGVETRDKETTPWSWRAGGVGRGGARLVSGAAEGAPDYGGTPADRAVVQGLRALAGRGLAVTYSPFLFMDIPPGNSLPDPHGATAQSAFPWRGRIVPMPGSDVDQAIAAFLGAAEADAYRLDGDTVSYLGPPDDWGYRRFLLHQAWLARAAGGVEAFLLGSELRGLTRARTADGRYPFVDGLRRLAADVRDILGPQTAISYAADWTEYGAHRPDPDGGEVAFPLDPLWADTHVDAVGIDWYPPIGDWRDGDDHLDARAGYRAADDPAYLAYQMTGGEGYDWYYASDADRDAQRRTPIEDTAHGEHWIFRPKDLANWWSNVHHPRPGGVRAAAPTAWVPGAKPIWLMELGVPAVARGGNAPNLFYDPKSSESALPPYSSGARDDVYQRRALAASLAHFRDRPEVGQVFVWAWDGRPWPDWPGRVDLWTDGPNWQFGHWLNGRVGLVSLADAVAALCGAAGVTDVDVSALDGVVEGLALDGPMLLRRALDPLALAYGFDLVETETGLRAAPRGQGRTRHLAPAELAEPEPRRTRDGLETAPGRLVLSFADPDAAFAPGTVEARWPGGDLSNTRTLSLPLALGTATAERMAADLLAAARTGETLSCVLAPGRLDVAPGDMLVLPGGQETWRVREVRRGLAIGVEAERVTARDPARALSVPHVAPPRALPRAHPELVVVDAPHDPAAGDDPRPLVAVAADPWGGPVTARAGADASAARARCAPTRAAKLGRLAAPLAPGPVGRWDRAGVLMVHLPGAELSSLPDAAVLAGETRILVETGAGWEAVSFAEADLVAPETWRLQRLLRGLGGSDTAAAAGAATGAMCLLMDGAAVRADLSPGEIGTALVWQAGPLDPWRPLPFENRQGLPWPVAHLRRADGRLIWIRRGPDIAESWFLPERDSQGPADVAWWRHGAWSPPERVDGPGVPVPRDALGARVRAAGTDGRVGAWVSIAWPDR